MIPAASRPTATASLPNVYTSLEFERILSPGGPYHGHVVGAPTARSPPEIAWLHCVGMRSDREGEHPYCSNFCCMVSLKQATIAREHIGPDLDMALFYMDMRTPRKDFEKYMVRIKDQGARLIRSRVHTITPVGHDGDLEVRYVLETGEVKDEIFDMVVLSVGMVIPPDVVALAKQLDVPLSPNNFVETSCFAPTTTFRDGIYSCGAFNGPKDIPQSVMEGSAAAGVGIQAPGGRPGHLDPREGLPPGGGPGGRGPPGGGVCLQLRPEHRGHRRCSRPGGVFQRYPRCGLRPGQPLQLLPGRPEPDGGGDQGEQAEPGGGGGLQSLHPSTHLPGHAPHRRPQQISL